MTQAAVLGANASIMSTPVGTSPGYQARAWVNFNGAGTVAIRASGNVSSITDNGTGQYTVNFTTAMSDANYAICTGGKQDLTYNDRFLSSYPVDASSCRLYFAAYSIGLYDPDYAFVSIFR